MSPLIPPLRAWVNRKLLKRAGLPSMLPCAATEIGVQGRHACFGVPVVVPFMGRNDCEIGFAIIRRALLSPESESDAMRKQQVGKRPHSNHRVKSFKIARAVIAGQKWKMELLSMTFEEGIGRQNQIAVLLRQAFPDMQENFYGSTKPWKLVLGIEGVAVVAHLAVYVRSVLVDGAPTEIGLLGGVAVAPSVRRRGVARALIAQAHLLLRQRRVSFFVLFALSTNTLSSGYVSMLNQTTFTEAGIRKQFVYRGGMVATLTDEPWTATLLDLEGEVV
ncbi:GNAT family N-acetyltransferase [Mesorhizobium sp. M0814]|uniref:GNAT family N-acetyltransferase n=1 Tax=unclassified Mesorhizobium TaxID=325217 RepID=UPI003339D9FF